MDYDYEIRRRTRRKHRSSRPVEYESKHSSFSPFSFRSRYRGNPVRSQFLASPNTDTDPPYPTHYPDTNYRDNITTLPADLKLSIFDHLDPASSTCLGLSSRHLYPSHRYMHRNVSLYEQADGNTPLIFQLRDWAPEHLMLDPRTGKYISRERYDRHEGRRSGRKRDYWDGKLRKIGKVTNLRRSDEKLRRVSKVYDLRGNYYGGWR